MANLWTDRREAERGYILLIAMILLAIISVIGASSLNVAGIDQRVALQNRKHMMVLNTADAGLNHSRWELEGTSPSNEGLTTDTASSYFVTASDAESNYGGIAYTHNLGVYTVEATFLRCGNPPPGYSTEIGRTAFRSDYWEMKSKSRMQDSSYSNINETQASAVGIYRKVMRGHCIVR